MKLKEALAKITLDSKSKQVRELSLLQKNLRFSCKRCATFCCRLGGPKLTRRDIERIEDAGYHAKDFLESATPGTISLKNTDEGSCILLRFDAEQERYECSIYDSRPILCRLYPFELEKIGSNVVLLKLITCCTGLNNAYGKVVDEKFVNNHLLAHLLEATGL